MPVDMTTQSIAVADNWVKVGNDYIGSQPNGATSGGTAALGWSAPSGLVDGNTLTVTTDGTNPFGSVGPDFIMLVDAFAVATGELNEAAIRTGTGVTLAYASNGNGKFQVDSVSRLGKGIRVGCLESFSSSNEGTDYAQIEVEHAASTKFFESRMTYWPAANAANSESVLALTNGTNRWGMKPIWNFANLGEFSGQDTDVYMVGTGSGFYNPDNRFLGQILCASNSQSIGASNLSFSPLQNAIIDSTDTYERPYDEVYTLEAAYDQGSADGSTLDAEITAFQSRESGGINKITNSSILCSDPDGVDRVVSAFTYPGFVRGYSIPENCHRYETDIYKANGAGAFCRVAISNNSDYFQSTLRAIQEIDDANWSNTSLTIDDMRTGIFQGDLTGCYINIIGINNTQIGSIAL